MPDPPGFQRLAGIRVPTLVLVGDRDVPGMVYIARRLHARIPGSTLVVLNGADHIANVSRPKEFNRTVVEFLAGVDRGSTRPGKRSK